MEQKWQMKFYFGFRYGFVLNFQVLYSLSSSSFACSIRCSGCLGFCRVTSIVLFLLDDFWSICQIHAHRTYNEKLCSENASAATVLIVAWFPWEKRVVPAIIKKMNLKLQLENLIWQEYFAWLDFILKLNSDSWNNSVNTGCITPKWFAQTFILLKMWTDKFFSLCMNFTMFETLRLAYQWQFRHVSRLVIYTHMKILIGIMLELRNY